MSNQPQAHVSIRTWQERRDEDIKLNGEAQATNFAYAAYEIAALRACLAAGAPAETLTAAQIAAGAAVLGEDGKPVGRNTAIMVADAMRCRPGETPKPVAKASFWKTAGASGWEFKWMGKPPGDFMSVDLFAAQPAPAPATDARELQNIDLGHGARLQRSAKTTGGVTWLMYNEHGLVRSLSVSEVQIVQATIAAMFSANSPREAG